MAKRKPKFLKRTLKSTEYVVYRDRKGRLRKFRTGLLLVAEVRNRKTNKSIGYLNGKNKDTGKPNPRKFTKINKAFQEATTTTNKLIPFPPMLTFNLKSSKLIETQIPKKFVQRINENLAREKVMAIQLHLIFNDGVDAYTSDIVLRSRLSRAQFAKFIAVYIANTYRSVQIRFSPKKEARNIKEKNRPHYKTMLVETTMKRFV